MKNKPWLNTGGRCAGQRSHPSSSSRVQQADLSGGPLSPASAQRQAIFSCKKNTRPPFLWRWGRSAHTHARTKKISGMKTFWKKFSRRKRTHISVAVYIIICLTTLFLLFLPLVLILLLCCFQNMTEIDGADSRAGERLSAAFLIGGGGHFLLHFLRVPQLQCY